MAASSVEGIGCPPLRTPRFPKIVAFIALVSMAASGCAASAEPEPEVLLEEAFSRPSLLAGDTGPTSVEVASLGYRDRVLDYRQVAVPAGTHREILEALASGPSSEGAAIGLLSVAGELETGDRTEIGGVEVVPVSGTIEPDDLVDALKDGDRSGLGEELGAGDTDSLAESLAGLDFTAWVSTDSDQLERLDLIVELDDPGNALPPSRLRFRLDRGTRES